MNEVRMPVKAMYAWIKKTRNMLAIQVLSGVRCSQWGMGLVGAKHERVAAYLCILAKRVASRPMFST